jgi:hypothetical protein
MADVYAPRACTEREALDLLTAEAARGDDRLAKARLEFDASVVRRVTLWLPDIVGQPEPPAAAVGLDAGLPRLLVNRLPEPERAAAPGPERLFIARDIDPAVVVRAVRSLERFATPCRVAHLGAHGGGDVWLLHVLVDRHRHSGYSALAQGGLFDAWDTLAGYGSDGCRVFLSEGVPLASELLHGLEQLLATSAAVDLLKLYPQGPRDEPFYIVHRTGAAATPGSDLDFRSGTNLVPSRKSRSDPAAGGAYALVTLPERAFVDSADVGCSAAASVAVSPLERAARPADLLKDLGDRSPGRGYRLDLVSARADEHGGRELEQLWSQQAYLSQRIAYAESLRRPRPVLLRFTGEQLPALAHTIYSFAPESLFSRRPRVRYGFEATRGEPAGRHYLLIEPDAVRRAPDPAALYRQSPAMKFWLDPSWGRYYFEEAGASAFVFVPEHTALVPPLHAWAPENMDEHLRCVFAKPWLRANGLAERPDAAYLYILDQTGGAIELSVLDRQAFQPIASSIRWLNDNLTMTDRVDVTKLVGDTAAGLVRDALAESAIADVPSTMRTFGREAARARERFLKDLDSVITSVNRSTFDVLQRAHLAIDAMKALDAEMEGLADIHERAQGIASIGELLSGIDTLTTLLADRVRELEVRVGETVRQADRQAEEEGRRVGELVQSLEAKRNELRARLQRRRA